MGSSHPSDGLGSSLYRSRVGEPTTDDEVLGYWVFVVGALAGVALFLQSGAASSLREAAIVLAAAGLTLLMIGPVIRSPLRRTAGWLSYAGALVCAAAIVYFALQFPENWSPQTGNQPSIVAYAAGMGLIVVGAVVVPLLAGPSRDEEAAERAALDEDELDRTRERAVDAEADEADLAAELGALRRSQARFELYEDNAGEWRWRLRHDNGEIIADGGEGYGSRSAAHEGLESVKRNAPGADVEA